MHAGLLPAGFSAEHFGPNDHYYWDDFWAVSGLECAAEIFETTGDKELYDKYSAKARQLRTAIDDSLKKVAYKLKRNSIPVSPYRRMDSGAVGSVVCGYPLQVFDADDQRLLATADYLMDQCRYKKGFFLDISHSGINPYLTLHIAQVLMRAGDLRHIELADTLSRLSSATGQWPEAVHPRTEGGCMGDGQHIWAAAEWVNYIRNCFVYEEEKKRQLILGAGIDPGSIKPDSAYTITNASTLWGSLDCVFEPYLDKLKVKIETDWFDNSPELIVRIPGYQQAKFEPGAKEIFVSKKD
jgi:hypothetical protein